MHFKTPLEIQLKKELKKALSTYEFNKNRMNLAHQNARNLIGLDVSQTSDFKRSSGWKSV